MVAHSRQLVQKILAASLAHADARAPELKASGLGPLAAGREDLDEAGHALCAIGLGGAPLPFPVFTFKNVEDQRNRLKIRGTPHTIVIDGKGMVKRVWTGAFTGARQSEVESFFNVRLPGLAPASAGNTVVR